MARQALIAPSILSADFARLAEEAAAMKALGADWLHVDVMDGHFVPNLTLGPPIVRSLRAATDMPLDCHLMISDPATYGPQFIEAGADGVTFHIETTTPAKARELCQEIKERGARAGVSVKPGTPIDAVLELGDVLDLLLIMTVEPGFGGQSFMADMLDKVRRAAQALPERVHIQVDGGLNPQTTKQAAAAGANVIVAGSAIFKAQDRRAAIAGLRAAFAA